MSDAVSVPTCGWRTGVRICRMLSGTNKYCGFHAHWVRLVERGRLDRQQYDEFCVWWEQFQPWGIYGDRPGQWWASIAVLWAALTGLAEAPKLTAVINNELILRRWEVSRYVRGVAWDHDPWPRLTGEPMPKWERTEWEIKVADRRYLSPSSEVV